MPAERVLKALLRLGFDKRTARDAEQGIVSIEDALEELEEQSLKTQDALAELTAGTEILAIAGEQLSGIGRAIADPLTRAAEEYVRYAGRADAVSRDWLDTMQDLEKAQVSVGRAAAQTILPMMETAADLAEKAADFVSEHPEIIRAALKIGAVVAGLGAVGMAVTKGIRLYADIRLALMATQQLAAGIAMRKAARDQLVAAGIMTVSSGKLKSAMSGILGRVGIGAGRAAGGAGVGGVGAAAGTMAAVVGSVLLGALAGLSITDLLAKSEFGERLEEGFAAWFDMLGVNLEVQFVELNRIATVAAYGLGQLIGGEEKALEWAAAVGQATGALEDAAEAGRGLADTLSIPEQALQAYIEFMRMEAEEEDRYLRELEFMRLQYRQEDLLMEEQYQRRRFEMERDRERDEIEAAKDHHRQQEMEVRDYAREEARTVGEHRREMVRSARDFARDESRELDEYYRERAEMARDFGTETQRMEEDHQRDMRRMQEDHDASMTGHIRSRDALAMVEEERAFEQERQRAEEDYGIDASRRHADYARQMADMEANFARQRALRLEDHSRQLAEEQARMGIEQSLREQEFLLRQKDAEEEFDYERDREALRFGQQMRDLDEEQEYERGQEQERREFEQDMEQRRFDEERVLARQHLSDRLREIDEDTGMLGDRERARRNQYYELMIADADIFMRNMRRTYAGFYYATGRQAGGYVGPGVYRMGEAGREFVLSAPTTRAAERSLGRLDQEVLLAGLAGAGMRAGGKRPQLTLNQNYTFQGGFSEAERGWFRQTARQQAADAFSEILQ